MRIHHNPAALNARNAVQANERVLSTALQRLATGNRINGPKDGNGAFVLGEHFKLRIRSLHQAIANTQSARHAYSGVQTALGSMEDHLVRLRGLATMAVAATGDDLKALMDDAALTLEMIHRVSQNTSFGGRKLLQGDSSLRVEGAAAGAFSRIDIRSIRASSNHASEHFDLQLTGLAERARVETDFVFGGAGLGALQDGSGAPVSLTVAGNLGSTSVSVSEDTTVSDIVASINGSAAATGVYASSYAVFGTELATGPFALAATETAGGTFTIDVTVGGNTVTVTGDATGDADIDGTREVTGADLERALNEAGLGHFTVEADLDDAAGTASYFIRRAGTDVFSLQATGGALLALNAASAAMTEATLHGDQAVGAIGLAPGRVFQFHISYEDPVDADRLQTRQVSVTPTGGGGAFVTAADLQNALNAATGLGVFAVDAIGNTNGTVNGWGLAPAFRIRSTDPNFRAFSITETAGGSDAAALGLQSYSGGGRGMGSFAFGALGLFSVEHGSAEYARLQVGFAGIGSGTLGFGAVGAGPLDSSLGDFGRDVQVMLEGRRFTGAGLSIQAATPRVSLTATLGRTASRDALGAGLRYLSRADATTTTDVLLGTGLVQAALEGDKAGSLTPEVRSDAAALGIYDEIGFDVRLFDPANPEHRYGVGIQLGDTNSPTDYYLGSLPHFDVDTLGLPLSLTPGAQDALHALEGDGGVLRDIAPGGPADFQKDPLRAAAIIDAALSQVRGERAHLGSVQTEVLDRTEARLRDLADALEVAHRETVGADYAQETQNIAMAQLRVSAGMYALARANDLHLGLLDLLE